MLIFVPSVVGTCEVGGSGIEFSTTLLPAPSQPFSRCHDQSIDAGFELFSLSNVDEGKGENYRCLGNKSLLIRSSLPNLDAISIACTTSYADDIVNAEWITPEGTTYTTNSSLLTCRDRMVIIDNRLISHEGVHTCRLTVNVNNERRPLRLVTLHLGVYEKEYPGIECH